MKTVKKVGVTVLGILLLIVSSVLFTLFVFFPRVDSPPEIKISVTPERINRGEYLANAVSVCMDCHSKRNWEEYSGPLFKGTEGAGGELFSREFGFPGEFYARNITPYGLKNWTDGEIYRTITSGVDKDGKALFPIMPFHLYNQMHDDDIYSIIAYLRSLPSIENDVKKREVDFPFNLILRTLPSKREKIEQVPDKTNQKAYGAYVTNAAGCIECHTPVSNGKSVEDMFYAGGRDFTMPGGIIRSSNLTPDKTGIGTWSKELFIHKFKQYQDSTYKPQKLKLTDANTIMPWKMYSQMTEEDLGAIFDYLNTLKPVINEVKKFN